MNASGQDVQIWPDTGRLAGISGRTQYIRSRNDWGDWFGNDNSHPMYHFPTENRYLRRNKAVSFSENKQQLFDPPVAPPVYPLSETVDRFNDLFAANRFTSACSAIVVRSKSLGDEFEGNALVCEPVHNLVHRAVLDERGATYRADRAATEQKSEFLRSSDPWFRPVRVAIGPDGMIWVVDMYRAVIEHPEWIPQAWQQQIDLRAGSHEGRIYRVAPTDATGPRRLPNLSKQSNQELIALLESGNGTLRDMVQQELLHRGDKSIAEGLRKLAATGSSPQARVHALWTLESLEQLHDAQLLEALGDEHPGVVRNAILLTEPRIGESDALLQTLAALADHPDVKVKLQLALTLGESKAPATGEALGRIVVHAGDDRWLAQAIISSSQHHSLEVLKQLLVHLQNQRGDAEALSREVKTIADLMATARAAGANPSTLVAGAIADADAHASWIFPLAAACAETIADKSELDQKSLESIRTVYQRAKTLSVDPAASSTLRCQAIQLLGRSLGPADQERSLLAELLSATTPLEVQLAAIERLAAFRDRESADQLLGHWPDMSFSIREAVAQRLITNAASTDALVAKLESGTILPSDLSPAVRQTLRQSGSQTLQARINRVLGNTTAANQNLVQQYLQFQEENAETANQARGHELFQKHCAVCHVPDAAGRAPGPELSNLTDRSRIALTEAILVPNRAVEPQYRGYIVIKEDGRALSGTVAEEAGDTVTLALADGRRETIRRSEIEEFRNTGLSLMPEGFQQELDHSMLRDLIEYMRSESFLQSANRRRNQ